MFIQKPVATIVYINKVYITKAQPRLQGQVEANEPRYYTSISVVTKAEVQILVW